MQSFGISQSLRVEIQNNTAILENSLEAHCNLKHLFTTQPRNLSPRYLTKRNKNICIHINGASLPMRMKEESEKVGLKFNIQKTKIMASGPITSWQIEGGKVETVTDFIFLDSKITADGDCSHEIKRSLLLGGKVMINLDSILKSKDITLVTKVLIFKAMVFPVVM